MSDKNTNPKLKKNGGEGTKVGNFLRSLGAKKTLGDIVKVTGNILTGDIAQAVDIILGSDELTPEQQQLALKELELDIVELQEITKRWEADMNSDSKRTKHVRPNIMYLMTFALIVFVTLDSSIPGFNVDESWLSLIMNLLLMIYGAYFGLRGWKHIETARKK